MIFDNDRSWRPSCLISLYILYLMITCFPYRKSKITSGQTLLLSLNSAKNYSTNDLQIGLASDNIDQRAMTSVIVDWFVEHNPCSSTFALLSSLLVSKTYAGFLGDGRTISLLNMRTTADIVGRSLTSSCTHKSPIWIHLKASSRSYDCNVESRISKALSSFHSFQTCEVIKEKYCQMSYKMRKPYTFEDFFYLRILSNW